VGGLRALTEPDAPSANDKQPTSPPSTTPTAPQPTPPGAEAQAPQGAQLKWTGPADAKAGDTIELKLALNTATPLRGLPMEIAFSKDKLQLLDVSEAEFFKQDGAPTSFSKSGDVKDGKLNAGVLRNQATGVSGQGNVITLRFKALAAGTGEVRIVMAQPIALGAGAPPPALPLPWTVQIR
jgi:general secretion pathway protein D